MLRSSNTALKNLQWRSPLIALRHQSTATAAAAAPTPTPTPEAEKQQQPKQQKQPLSARLGGSGRGKTLEASDPFSQFLNNGQQRNKRMQQRGKPRTNAATAGQFDDATTGSDEQQKRQQRPKRQNNNNNNNRQQQQNRPKRQEASSSSSPSNGDNNRMQRQQRQQQRQGGKNTRKGGLENRRVTTFIDKDIDWTAMNALEESQESETFVGSVDSEQTAEDREKMMLELQTGDYDRYFQASKGMEFGSIINVDSMNSLLGSNASYAFDQKTAFLAAVSKASASAGAAAAKK